MGDEDKFVEEIVTHEKETHPDLEKKYEDEKLREMVRSGIKRAKKNRFVTSQDIRAFIAIMFEIAPNFDEEPEIKAVLDDKKIPTKQRFDNLWSSLVSDEAWEEAEANYDEAAWELDETDD